MLKKILHPHVPTLPGSVGHFLHKAETPLHALYFGLLAAGSHEFYMVAGGVLCVVTVGILLSGQGES